jgi:translocation protein SEC63
MLDYDNSAFYYFALTLLSFYLVPGLWFTLSEIYAAFVGKADSSIEARTSIEKEKSSKLKKAKTGTSRLKRWPFLLNLCFLVPALLIFFYLIVMVKNDGEVTQFDPYRILEIEHGSSSAEIKKSYRRLSLKYHPDKNIGDKAAEEKFMKIAKAYEALTDETSKENYEKFGNPDGKQALEVSIGLPKIILENPKVVLVLYLILLVVVIPVSVGLWYAYSKQFGEKNIMYDTYSIFYQVLLFTFLFLSLFCSLINSTLFMKLLTESHRIKHMPEVIAASAECQKINSTMQKDESQQLGNHVC